MNSPLQIEYRNTQPMEVVDSRIRQELAELEKFYNRLVSCRVEVEVPEHERRGQLCKVFVHFGLPAEDAAIPGVVAGQGEDHLEVKAQRKDAAMAVHAAFNTALHHLKESGRIPPPRA